MRRYLLGATLLVLFSSTGADPVQAQQNDIFCDNPDPDYLLCDDFEGGVSVMDDILAGDTTSSISSAAAYSGSRSLEMDGASSGKFSSRHYLSYQDGSPAAEDTLYARYMFRVGNAGSGCWDGGQEYKNMGFEGGSSECKGGRHVSDGTDCFTARTRFSWPNLGVRFEGFLGVGEGRADGEQPEAGKMDTINENVDVADGQWHCFEMQVKMNDPDACVGFVPPADECNAGGSCDGEVRYWVDGDETVCGNLYIRTVDSLKIDKWWFTYWANDDWCGPLYVDDLVISRSRIGCPGSPPNGNPPPAPLNLRIRLR